METAPVINEQTLMTGMSLSVMNVETEAVGKLLGHAESWPKMTCVIVMKVSRLLVCWLFGNQLLSLLLLLLLMLLMVLVVLVLVLPIAVVVNIDCACSVLFSCF